jgi:hypothetical protein
VDDALGHVDGVVAPEKHEKFIAYRMTHFSDLWQAACERSQSNLAIGIVPHTDQLPPSIQRYDDPFLPLGRSIIDATSDLAAAYVFHLGAYLATGAAGAIALERTIAYIPNSVVKIIHAPFTNADFVRAAFEDAFGADAVTLATAERDIVAAYARTASHGVFIERISRAALESLAVEFAGQIGGYLAVGTHHNTMWLADPDLPVLQWHWDHELYPSRGDDFEDALREAVLKLRMS